MGCGASKGSELKEGKPKKSNAGHPEPTPAAAVNNAIRTREYYRNSLGNDFLEGFSRTGRALSRKNTMRSQGSISCDQIDPNRAQDSNVLSDRKENVMSARETAVDSQVDTQAVQAHPIPAQGVEN